MSKISTLVAKTVSGCFHAGFLFLNKSDSYVSYIPRLVVPVPPPPDPSVLVRILAGCTTGAMAVSFAQPTDVVKVRFQAQMNLDGVARRYNGTMQAYKHIFQNEGIRGLWKGAIYDAPVMIQS